MTRPIPPEALAAAALAAKTAGKQKQLVEAILKAEAHRAAAKTAPGRCMCTTMGWGPWDWEYWFNECYTPLPYPECGGTG